jgi:glycine dehydrogenase subunit 1
MNYVSNTDADRAAMLQAIGVTSTEDLFVDLPRHLRQPKLSLPAGLSEVELNRLLPSLARRNANLAEYACFLGAGAYSHFIPSVVGHVVGRSEFATSYTPYQPELSQGTLQTIFEFQSAICELTGMDVSNASMYDGATSVAEAAILAQNATRRHKVVVSPGLNPDYLAVLNTYTAELDTTVEADWGRDYFLRRGKIDITLAADALTESACLIVQQPNFFGVLEPVAQLADAAHSAGALLIVVVDPISLGLFQPPGAYGADVAVGEGQSLGNAISFGGPYVGFFATSEKYLRQMPGRIVGQTTDHEGRRGFVLTLQAREQHIRREKATSNICTNEALNALAALAYLSALGPHGLRKAAELCVQKSHYAAERINSLKGYELVYTEPFFKEFVIRCPRPAAEVNNHLLQRKIIGGYDLARIDASLTNHMLLCVTEMNTKEEIDLLVSSLSPLGRGN